MNGDILTSRIAALEDRLERASMDAAAGFRPDLSGMESMVEALCRDLKKADPDTARTLLPGLAALITGLERLAQELNKNTGGNKSNG